jgi:glycopeptide antibiotics resistance protein
MKVNPGPALDQHANLGYRETAEIFVTFLPVLLIWAAIAFAVSRRLAAFLQTQRWVAFLLLVSLGLILGATLTPTPLALESGAVSSGECDLARLRPLTPAELITDFDGVVNVLLFVPLGFALSMLPRTSRNLVIIAGAFLLTFAIELTQMLVPSLGRGCESADMIDNTQSLMAGLVAGLVVSFVMARYHERRDADAA